MLAGQGVRGTSGIILVNCESSVSSIKGLRVIFGNYEFEGPPCVSVVSRYIQLTLLRARNTTRYSAKSLSVVAPGRVTNENANTDIR